MRRFTSMVLKIKAISRAGLTEFTARAHTSFDTRKPTTDDKIIMCSTCVDDYGNRQLVCMYRGEEVVD